MIYNQGDIVLLPFPFTNQFGTKVRPGIVVSNSLVNNTSTDVIIVQLTTQNPNIKILTVEIDNNHVSIPFKPPHTHNIFIVKRYLLSIVR